MEPAAVLADRLVRARRGSLALTMFPGSVPKTAESAYAVQQEAIRLWGERPVGWKIGAVRKEWQAAFGGSRFVGPVFREGVLRPSEGGLVNVPLVVGGFGVVEAEIVLELSTDLPKQSGGYSIAELNQSIGRAYVGVEIAGSSIPDIVALGPGAVIADFGVNRGLVIGPEISDWRTRSPDSLCVTISWDDEKGSAVSGSSAMLEGGLVGALATCVDLLAANGASLKKGDLISTGAICGLRPLAVGRRAIIKFMDMADIVVCFHLPGDL